MIHKQTDTWRNPQEKRVKKNAHVNEAWWWNLVLWRNHIYVVVQFFLNQFKIFKLVLFCYTSLIFSNTSPFYCLSWRFFIQNFFCFSTYISIYFSHILFLLHAFATLISFLQETKFFPCHPDWALVYIPESTVSNSSVGYLYESANPIVEHVHVSEGKLKGALLVFFPFT